MSEPLAESVCKLCRSTGPDVPCAYPTEINRQQAKRIANLQAQIRTLEVQLKDAIAARGAYCKTVEAFVERPPYVSARDSVGF